MSEIPDHEGNGPTVPNDSHTDFSSDEIIPEEILRALPEEERAKVGGIIRQTLFAGVMGRSNPVAEKITPEHITQIISTSDEQDKRERVSVLTD